MGDPEVIEPLVDALAQEESLRVKNRVARGLEQAGWSIPEALTQRCEAALPPGYAVKNAKVSVSVV
jgi:HEAT repeat protein